MQMVLDICIPVTSREHTGQYYNNHLPDFSQYIIADSLSAGLHNIYIYKKNLQPNWAYISLIFLHVQYLLYIHYFCTLLLGAALSAAGCSTAALLLRCSPLLAAAAVTAAAAAASCHVCCTTFCRCRLLQRCSAAMGCISWPFRHNCCCSPLLLLCRLCSIWSIRLESALAGNRTRDPTIGPSRGKLLLVLVGYAIHWHQTRPSSRHNRLLTAAQHP